MHELTHLILNGMAASARQRLPQSPAAKNRRLGPWTDVFEIEDRVYAVAALFAQVDHAFSKGSTPLRDVRGGTAALEWRRDVDELAIVGSHGTAIVPGLRLASASARRRLEGFDRLLQQAWLGPQQTLLRKRAAERPFTPRELNDLHALLDETVETHLTRLDKALKSQSAKYTDLEWCSHRGLELLFGEAQSAAKPEALAASVQARQRARLRDEAAGALAIALSVALGGHWPIKPAPKGLDAKGLFAAACPGGRLGDPFATLAAIDLAQRNALRLRTASVKILELLETEPQGLKNSFDVYAGAVVVSFAALSEHPQTRTAPVLWRRVAAHVIAGLQTARIGALGPKLAPEFFLGARGAYGLPFDLATALAAFETPRWLPLFASREALMGFWWRRLRLIASKVADAEIKSRLEAVGARMLSSIDGTQAPLAIFFPSPTDGFRTDEAIPRLAEVATSAGVDAVADATRAVQWRALANGALISPPTAAMGDRAAQLVQQTTIREMIDEDGDIPPDITGSAYVVATLERQDLARVLASKLITAATSDASTWPMTQAVQALLVLAAADCEPASYRDSIRTFFEGLAFGVAGKAPAEALEEQIEIISRLSPGLASVLARAKVAANVVRRAA